MRPRNLITISLREDQIAAICWYMMEDSPSKAVKKLINEQMPFIISKMSSSFKSLEIDILNWIKKDCEEKGLTEGKTPNLLLWMIQNIPAFEKEYQEAKAKYEKEQEIQKEII